MILLSSKVQFWKQISMPALVRILTIEQIIEYAEGCLAENDESEIAETIAADDEALQVLKRVKISQARLARLLGSRNSRAN